MMSIHFAGYLGPCVLGFPSWMTDGLGLAFVEAVYIGTSKGLGLGG